MLWSASGCEGNNELKGDVGMEGFPEAAVLDMSFEEQAGDREGPSVGGNTWQRHGAVT